MCVLLFFLFFFLLYFFFCSIKESFLSLVLTSFNSFISIYLEMTQLVFIWFCRLPKKKRILFHLHYVITSLLFSSPQHHFHPLLFSFSLHFTLVDSYSIPSSIFRLISSPSSSSHLHVEINPFIWLINLFHLFHYLLYLFVYLFIYLLVYFIYFFIYLFYLLICFIYLFQLFHFLIH